VLLSLPVLGAIRAASPKTRIGFLARASHAPLLRGHPWIDEILEWHPEEDESFTGACAFGRRLVGKDWESALSLQANGWLSFGLRMGGVRHLAGPRSKIHSYFLFHSSLRQHRSRAEKHEAEYGLGLLSLYGLSNPVRLTPTVTIESRVLGEAGDWLNSNGMKPVFAIHPGMGGSAANWEASRYVALAEQAEREGMRVLVTAGPGEESLLLPFRARCPGALFFEAGMRGIDFLGALFSQMRLIVAPSTGPLHLAVALGRPTVSVYPTKRVEHPTRWGPYDPEGKAPHSVLLLDGANEPTVDQVFGEVTRLLAGTPGIG